MSEFCKIYRLLNQLEVREEHDPYLNDAAVGDWFYYFCGEDSARTVIGRFEGYGDYYPFEDTEPEEALTMPLVSLWIELGASPSCTFGKVVNKEPTMWAPEFYLQHLYLFYSGYFYAHSVGKTVLSFDEADAVCIKSYDYPVYIVQESSRWIIEQVVGSSALYKVAQ